tara:strand:+ start:140990 stop:142093 length:1104 start_codon:yes stop_codon:yes gene_type:complete
MTLNAEIDKARKTIATDGYEMSVGEVINLYKDEEIRINPAFQRLFRWDLTRKSRFIESLLLGIPIPPIFVYQDDDGVWELIDGLQRLSTILEFVGQLRDVDDESKTWHPSMLTGTKLVPSLQDKVWSLKEKESSIGRNNQIAIKRARIRVEILKQESDPNAKFELFQRLNTGGASLSPQEVRNCVAVMINKDFNDWLTKRAKFGPFLKTVCQTDTALEKQAAVELVLRFLAFRLVPYDNKMDVHEYLDDALIRLAELDGVDWDDETDRFERAFSLLDAALGTNAFKRWNGTEFSGKFLMSVYESLGCGLSHHLEEIEAMNNSEEFILEKAKALWSESTFNKYSGAGIRGTTRLDKLLPFSMEFLNPK